METNQQPWNRKPEAIARSRKLKERLSHDTSHIIACVFLLKGDRAPEKRLLKFVKESERSLRFLYQALQ
ncbi:hypothetical protein AB0758_32990 [Tolypothrix bouteillei VB521301_2]|uniref:Uncharacterized protein n=1 Tax=Tolypothrix bouteillei VB521301 TaxID=1479485 RepID=A0A8S9SW35_9CYAN|nr:hypothetical protein [Tolypothrix bouteillei]KAF3884088.1 hypothetical protein DA73_0400000155 [Tolypothrix bouteillei VB521301]